jgi:Type II CAAX prenyl endopeptidase Rce1-like
MRALTEEELENPTFSTLVRLVVETTARLFRDRIGIVLGSAFVVLMLWGTHGNLELLGIVWQGWEGPGSDPATRATILPGIAWGQEWVSFWAGVALVVGIPVLIIKLGFRQSLTEYGLGLPPPGRRKLAALSAVALFGLSLPFFFAGAQNPGMQDVYPLFKAFESDGDFFLYELGYFGFFLAIEFIFRGYLLFGLFQLKDQDAPFGVSGESGPLVFGYYAILISMLSYTAWHLGKPVPELWGTLVWGILAGTIALATRTIWPIVIVHWLLNVFMDLAIYKDWDWPV